MVIGGYDKIKKRVLYGFSALALLTGIIWTTGYLYGEPLLEKKLQAAFAKATQKQYVLAFDGLKIDYLSRGVSVKKLSIKSTSSVADSNNHEFNLTCDRVAISGVHFWKMIFGQTFSTEHLLLKNPTLTVHYSESAPERNLKEKESLGLFDISGISIQNAHVTVIGKKDKRLLFETKQFNMKISGFGFSADVFPVYQNFHLESVNNAVGLFPSQAFRLEKLSLSGDRDHTALNASGFDISEIDASLRNLLKIPPEITYSLHGISIESESLSNLYRELDEGSPENIRVAKLLLIQPSVSIRSAKKQAQENTNAPERIERVFKNLKLPTIDHMGIVDGEFSLRDAHEKKPVFSASDIHIVIHNLTPRLDQFIPFSYGDADISTGNCSFTYPNAEYTFTAKSLRYNSEWDELSIQGHRIQAHKSRDDFFKNKKWRTDWFDFSCDEIRVEKLGLGKLIEENILSPEKIIFKNADLKAHTNKQLHHNPAIIKPFPLEIMQSIKYKFDIGKVLFENGKATYSEEVANSPGIGALHLGKIRLEISGLKNYQVKETNTARLFFSCTLGGGSYAELFMETPLHGTDEIQLVRGSIRSLPFKQLNRITENTVFVGFSKGILDSCRFHFKAVNGQSEGLSEFHYHDLKVKIYKVMDVPAYKSKLLLSKTFASLGANFLINQNNPDKDGRALPGKMFFKRDKLKGPLNFWIKTIFSGLMNTAIDDISELQGLQDEIKSLKTSSETGLLSKIKGNPLQKKNRKEERESRKKTKNADETK